jgi:hypothetical protein
MTQYDSPSDKTDGTDESIDDSTVSRRQFLGAAAAAAALPVATNEGAAFPEPTIESDDTGCTRTSIPSGSPVFGAVNITEELSEESSISVSGYWYDDQPGEVECKVGVGSAHVTLSFSPDRAHELAAEFEQAALAAEESGDV